MPSDISDLRTRRGAVSTRSRSLAAFAWGTLREILMRQKRNLKYHHDFKLRVSLQLQRGGLTCRNLWTFSTFFFKLSTKSGEVQPIEIFLANRVKQNPRQGK